MFEPSSKPRVYALPPGVDFPKALLDGLSILCAETPPERFAQVHLVVNTRRMARRIRELFDTGPAQLLPKVTLLTEIGDQPTASACPPAISPLRRRLELANLVGRLLDREPDLAARSSLFDLADSLAELIDEMQGEGVSPDTIRDLDVSDMSGHWARTQAFFGIAQSYLEDQKTGLMDAQARQRFMINSLIDRWANNPPQTPVILAGSTGSRGTTAMLMAAVASLPQGAVVLPGFDFDQPEKVWAGLSDAILSEDHPQFRFRNLMNQMDIEPKDIKPWSNVSPPSPPRNKLISLALRPAPVTDAWLTEGQELHDLQWATQDVTLIEAPSPRTEALAIAIRLRQACETGQTAALITPDRMLTRQVSAALNRWNIVPDDSAGLPLHLSPPGRFLRHVAGLFARPLTSESLLTLLKHPLCHDGEDRGPHLLRTRDLELGIRQKGLPFPEPDSIAALCAAEKKPPPSEWINWVTTQFCHQKTEGLRPLSSWVDQLKLCAEGIAAGVGTDGSGALWEKNAGQKALSVISDLEAEAIHSGDMNAHDFGDLLGTLLASEDVRDRDAPHSQIMIWGTLEARVQGADLVILGGLNEGSWPESANPDPWLNRNLRSQAGLLLPERKIGLSAHDFQQAACAPEVWFSRSKRSDDAETVASRWLNRFTNLLGGLPEQGGPEVLRDMRARGQTWLDWAATLDNAPRTDPAIRPSPRPPVAARPKKLSVTEIKKLIRDPYSIYAKHVLRLRPLNPLVRAPDALLRGIVVHDFLELFVRKSLKNHENLSRKSFLELAEKTLEESVPWPAARRLWLARLERITDSFLASEIERQKSAVPTAFEAEIVSRLEPLDFVLTGRADRIDCDRLGRLNIYDYKTGTPPSQNEQAKFDKQLLIEAAIAEQGGFKDLDPSPVNSAIFIGVGGVYKQVPAPIEKEPPEKVLSELRALISAYMDFEQGFTSRRMLQKDSDTGDYDQLSRFGEWDRSTTPTPEDLT